MAKHTKFPSSVMALRVVNHEGHVVPPYFFLQDWSHRSAYLKMLDMVAIPWIEGVAWEKT